LINTVSKSTAALRRTNLERIEPRSERRRMLRLLLLCTACAGLYVGACPSFTSDEVPASCKIGAPKEGICTVCIDECCGMLESRTADIPCNELLSKCVRNIFSLLALGDGGVGSERTRALSYTAAGGMDVNTLLQCDPAAAGQRVAPLLKCQGTPPTADQISSSYRSILCRPRRQSRQCHRRPPRQCHKARPRASSCIERELCSRRSVLGNYLSSPGGVWTEAQTMPRISPQPQPQPHRRSSRAGECSPCPH
jgi:hypothetical protein